MMLVWGEQVSPGVTPRVWSCLGLVALVLMAEPGCAGPKPHPAAVVAPAPSRLMSVRLEAMPLHSEEHDDPRTEVLVLMEERGALPVRVPVGVEDATCHAPHASVSLVGQGGILDHLVCWWAGQGRDYWLRQQGNVLLVESQYTAEELGDGDEPPPEFMESVPLPEGVEVRKDGAHRD